MYKSLTSHNAAKLYLIAALTLCIWAYFPGLSGDFAFDDHHNIVENELIRVETLDFGSLWKVAWSNHSGPLRRPVSMVSFALNYLHSGMDARGMKITNLLIHIINGLILLLVLKLIFRELNYINPGYGNTIPYFISGIWLVHPINLTSVSYIVQRMTSLSSLFILLALYCYLRIRKKHLATRRGVIISLFMFIFWGIGVFSKEQAALLTFYILALEWCVYKFRIHTPAERIHLFTINLILIIPWIAGLIYIIFNPELVTGAYSVRDFTLPERLLTELRIVIHYIRLIIIPDITNMGIYHDNLLLSRSLFQPLTTLFSLMLILCLILGAVVSRHKFPLASLGFMWYLSGHLLESTIFGLELMFLHRNYIASIGILMVVAETGVFLLAHNKKAMTIFIILALVGLSICTRFIAYQWSDDPRMLILEAMNNPQSPRANLTAGDVYKAYAIASTKDEDKQRYKNISKSYFRQIHSIDPDNAVGGVAEIILHIQLEEHLPRDLVETATRSLYNTSIGTSLISQMKTITKCIVYTDCPLDENQYISMITTLLENKKLLHGARSTILNYYASYLWNKAFEYEKAIRFMSSSIDVDSTNINSHMVLILFYAELERYEEMKVAIQALEMNDKFKLSANFIKSAKIIAEEKAKKQE